MRSICALGMEHPRFVGIKTEYHDSLTRENDFPAASAPMGMGTPPSGVLVGPIEEFLNRFHKSIVAEYSAFVNCTHVYNSQILHVGDY